MKGMIRASHFAFTLALLPVALTAQGRPDPAALLAAQREAMTALASLDGTWRGEAWTLLPNGERHTLTQTERVGPFLDGAVKVIEGKGFEADGSVSFNAFGIISYDPARKAYSLRSYAQGHAGDFVVTPTATGFTWEIPAGPAIIRYTATIENGVWHEVGDRIMPGQSPVRFMEMTLTRLADSDWPAAGAIAPR